MMFDDENEELITGGTLADWLLETVSGWRDHYEANYKDKHEEYNRIWRGVWAAEDQVRTTERARLICPATQQAVESSVAEVEEATFGSGRWFDVKDELGDTENSDVQYLRNKLQEDFERYRIRQSICESLIISAVYGTAAAEVVLDTVLEAKPATQEAMDGQAELVGIETIERTVVKLRPLLPQNFLIDPLSTCIEDAEGCAIEEFVPEYQVIQGMENGTYRKVPIESAAPDSTLDVDPEVQDTEHDGKVRLIKYFGLVPRILLEEEMSEDDAEEDLEIEEGLSTSAYVEAIVVMMNDGVVLKAEPNPYMMKDRPVVAFSWDTVPGRFWGRGIVEKAYNAQKALDAELRARIDGLSLTSHPMMAMDATKMPRGFKPEIKPGKILLTQGPPADTFQPFNFGNIAQTTFVQAEALQKMVQEATGAIDSTGLLSSMDGAKTGAVSMSLGAVIKRHKRTVINFQQAFLVPFIEKAAHRYMLFDPDQYPIQDFKFIPVTTLGIIGREYEVQNLTQLLQTMQQDSPLYAPLIQSIVEHMQVSNREDLLAKLKAASEPTEEQQAQQQEMQELQKRQQEGQVRLVEAQAAAVEAQAQDSLSAAEKRRAEVQNMPEEMRIQMMKAATNDLKDDQEDKSFERRLALIDRRLKNKEIEAKRNSSAQRPNLSAVSPKGPMK